MIYGLVTEGVQKNFKRHFAGLTNHPTVRHFNPATPLSTGRLYWNIVLLFVTELSDFYIV